MQRQDGIDYNLLCNCSSHIVVINSAPIRGLVIVVVLVGPTRDEYD